MCKIVYNYLKSFQFLNNCFKFLGTWFSAKYKVVDIDLELWYIKHLKMCFYDINNTIPNNIDLNFLFAFLHGIYIIKFKI
jgi:hypothetical protein